jgi:hypothetical protein
LEGAKAEAAGRLKLGRGFGLGCKHHGQRGGDQAEGGGQGMLLDLSDQTDMVAALGISMQQLVESGRDRERESDQPEPQHQASGGLGADAPRLVVNISALHCGVIEHNVWLEASANRTHVKIVKSVKNVKTLKMVKTIS